jgi:hypothetical protein
MKLEMISALTPALSPRRGRIVRRVLNYATGQAIVYLTADDTKSVMAPGVGKLSSAVCCSLPPGGEGRGEGECEHQFRYLFLKNRLPYGAGRKSSHFTCHWPLSGKPGALRRGEESQPAAIIAAA